MKLPNPENAIITERKLKEYCLSPDHEEGQHKAYLFSKLLGFSEENFYEFKGLLLDAIAKNEVFLSKTNEYGVVHYVDFQCERHERVFKLRSIWIIRGNETFPRFVSCYIKRKNQA